jgi:hypothetical protein
MRGRYDMSDLFAPPEYRGYDGASDLGLDLNVTPDDYDVEMPVDALPDAGLTLVATFNCEGYGYGYNY